MLSLTLKIAMLVSIGFGPIIGCTGAIPCCMQSTAVSAGDVTDAKPVCCQKRFAKQQVETESASLPLSLPPECRLCQQECVSLLVLGDDTEPLPSTVSLDSVSVSCRPAADTTAAINCSYEVAISGRSLRISIASWIC